MGAKAVRAQGARVVPYCYRDGAATVRTEDAQPCLQYGPVSKVIKAVLAKPLRNGIFAPAGAVTIRRPERVFDSSMATDNPHPTLRFPPPNLSPTPHRETMSAFFLMITRNNIRLHAASRMPT
jgi:hypothetical protein